MIEAIIVCTVLLIGSGPEQCEIYNLEPQLERNGAIIVRRHEISGFRRCLAERRHRNRRSSDIRDRVIDDRQEYLNVAFGSSAAR